MATGNVTPQLYYAFDNANNANINNILINDAYSQSNTESTALPITSNLYARYEAKNYNPTAKTWKDSGPNGRDIPASSVTGTPTVVTNTVNLTNTNGLYKSYVAVRGGTGDKINFGNEKLNSWTLFAIVRYTGGSRGRILASNTINFLTGHHGGTAGVAYHEGWITPSSTDYYGNQFFINTDTAAKMYTNGYIRQTTGGNTITYLPTLYINQDPYSQSSDWEVIDIIFYNTELNDENKRAVELFLSSYYGIVESDTAKTVLSGLLYNSTTFSTSDYKKGASSLVLAGGAAGTASPYVKLPEFYTAARTGLTFAMWFKSNSSSDWSRLIDFGNGAPNDNIFVAIYGNNLVLSVQQGTAGTFFEVLNAYPSCNDNVWRHLVWTISPDGTTWKVYINGSLYATITSSNSSSYSLYTGSSTTPIYPNNVLRTLNYIGKSNWVADPYLKCSIDEFYFYNGCVSDTMVLSLYKYNRLILYYNFDNANNSNISNILLNNAYDQSTTTSTLLPVTTNLYARYEAKKYNAYTKVWVDSGPSARNIPASSVTGTPTVVTNTGNLTNTNGLYDSYIAVKGGINDKIAIGNEQLTSWTLFSIARYAGSNRGRILSGGSAVGANFILGHHGNRAGVAYHMGGLNALSPDTTYNHGTDFFIFTDTASKFYTNGVLRGSGGNTVTYLPAMYINDYGSEYSDWEIVEIIIYNTELSDENKRSVELFLSSYYGIINSDRSNSILSSVLYNSPTFSTIDYKKGASSLVLKGTSSQYALLPSFFTAAGTGLTFAMWFKSNSSSDWSRLIDFGNGAGSNNIIIAIYGNNLALSLYSASGNCQPVNVYPNCNDNVWRHLVWTISSDGLTWKIYINGSLYATITSANVSSYSQTGGVGPNYPDNVLRTLNYIGKSNWDNPYFIGSVDEFYFYNDTIDQAFVTNLYNSTSAPIVSLTYTYNNNTSLITVPYGTVYAYFGNTDPTGWVICDGQVRTNNSDGKYNNLFSMTIGSGGSGTSNYTPPDLRGSFLRGDGKGTAITAQTTGYGSYAATLGTPQNDSIGNHVHTGTTSSGTIDINDPGHHHHFYTFNDDWNCTRVNNSQQRPGFWTCRDAGSVARGQKQGRRDDNGFAQNVNWPVGSVNANLSDSGHIHKITMATNTTSVEVKPYNFSVNWIMKL